jgi:hypothetical protein
VTASRRCGTPRRVRTLPCLLTVATVLATVALASPARADSSAWVFVSGGAMAWKQLQDASLNSAGTMIVDAGAGSSPDGKVIIGGIFRFQPVFPHGGIDLSVLMRVATHGFQAGDWGFALDLGGFARAWGQKSVGFSGSASLGMPLGFTLMLQNESGIDHAFSFAAVAGIDLLRLTIYRQTLLKWWQNPSPAWKDEPSPTAGTPASFRF